MERSDLTSLFTSLTSSAGTALALLPFIVLFKGAFLLGIFLKDKVGHLLPAEIYTESLPYSTSFTSLMYNSRDHNNIHDLVQPHAHSSSFPSYDMVAVAAGTRPYSIKKQIDRTEKPRTYQRLVRELQDDRSTAQTHQHSGFWESFIKLKG